MSYNTRRNTGFSSTPQQQQTASSVGQRRPVVTNNFVPGGQLTGSQQQQKPAQVQQQQQQQRTPQQQQQPQAGINFRNQTAPPVQQQQTYQTQSYTTQQPPQQQQQQQQTPQTPRYQPTQPIAKQETRTTPQQVPVQPQTPVKPPVVVQTSTTLPGTNPPPPENNGDTMETNADGTKKRQWFKSRGKITKAEKVRRRNVRLSKILQPKNAVMILNELVKGCQYNVDELPCKIDANQFRATVGFEGQEFAGAGRTKNYAKNNAAETALKFLVKNKQLSLKKEEDSEGGDEKMEIGEEDGSQVMPWSHIASFAMYKLFSTWGEDPSAANRAQELMGVVPKAVGTAPPVPRGELKPAKKMPDNPERMNPLMLMNQMLPTAQWEEVGKSGVTPNVVFTFSVTVDGKQFTGTGTNKKAAKKLAAFSACHDILKIDYPADVWVPLY